MATLVILILFVVYLLFFGTLVYAVFKGAPWVPARKKQIYSLIDQLEIKETDLIYDLGSGDGRWLFALAKKTKAKHIVGLEISYFFYLLSRIKNLFSGYPQVKIKFQDLFKENLNQADVVICFLTPKAMVKLTDKFKKELKPGAKLISYAFKLPGAEPQKTFKISTNSLPIYLYQF